MEIFKLDIPGAFKIEPRIYRDQRGWFYESYNQSVYDSHGITHRFIQDNFAMSVSSGTLRGLHFQRGNKAQTKLITCCSGEILDVIVDLRKGSPMFGRYISLVLDGYNRHQLLIPKGVAHGYITLNDNTQVCYKVDTPYAPEAEGGIRFNDPELKIDWGVSTPILSQKDQALPFLKDLDCHFIYHG